MRKGEEKEEVEENGEKKIDDGKGSEVLRGKRKRRRAARGKKEILEVTFSKNSRKGYNKATFTLASPRWRS